MNEQRVVVFDPTGERPVGTIVNGVDPVRNARQTAVLLPVVGDLVERGGAMGWVKREWGAGFRYTEQTPRHGCRVVLNVQAGLPALHWAARVVPDAPGGTVDGHVRLSAESGRPSTVIAALFEVQAVQLDRLAAPDAQGGWTIGGKCKLGHTIEGFLPLSLFGCVQGGRVQWLAVSQTP